MCSSRGRRFVSDSFGFPENAVSSARIVHIASIEKVGDVGQSDPRTPNAKLAQHFESMIDVRAACARRLARSGGAKYCRTPSRFEPRIIGLSK